MKYGLYDESFEKDSCGIGLIVNAKQPAQHRIVAQGLEMLSHLAHRSALGADGKTSDGAGILLQIPDRFFRARLKAQGVELPPAGHYAVAQVFVAPGFFTIADRQELLAAKAAELGMTLLHRRPVPVKSGVLGREARATEPEVHQIFFAGPSLEKKKLFILKRWAENHFRKDASYCDLETGFYICSLSSDSIVYKGLMRPEDLGEYYPDLRQTSVGSRWAMVHSRFSTNTLPAWELAQPFRHLCHNGEINTIRGNRQWMKAREADFNEVFDREDPQGRGSLLSENRSDSNSFDEAFELLLLTGASPVQAMMTLIPEPWETDLEMPQELKDFYAFQAQRMEPWDGPAAICFADGDYVGAVLDRNGLRPCRYQILKDGTLIAGSEAGALEMSADRVEVRGRLGPGQMILVDLKTGGIDMKNETKRKIASEEAYGSLLQRETLRPILREISPSPRAATSSLWSRAVRFGYHYDEILQVLLPMFLTQDEATSSMGADTPLAILSERPQLLSNYFRQLFAQVTNPPIDSIREKSVMSLRTFLGSRASPFSRGSDGQKRWVLEHPFLDGRQMSCLRSWLKTNSRESLKTALLPMAFSLTEQNLQARLAWLRVKAEEWVRDGHEVLILSDRSLSEGLAAIPPLLAVSAVHSHLIQKNLRMKTSLVVESAEVRDVHQMACLISFGADAIHSYFMEELCRELKTSAYLPKSLSAEEAFGNYFTALKKGLLKIQSKLGISTLQSYRGAQTFEILGLNSELVDSYFPGAISRIGGLGMGELSEEIRRRWQDPRAVRAEGLADLSSVGDIHYRTGGEFHHWNPTTISKLQLATRNKDPKSFSEFSEAVKVSETMTLRGHLRFRSSLRPVSLPEVEPASEIVKRFTSGAMSLGALSAEAHETLALAMNQIGGKSNSGEGGEDAGRFLGRKNSAIKQIASARFGVTIEYLNSAKEIQIKMAQGAKPGEGGQLPGHKVDKEIARLRHSTPGVTLISPPPHHDIYSIEDLAQLIFDLKCANPEARVSVKLVSEAGVGTIATGVAKALAQKILISGDGGGTGASRLSSIRHAGLPWELGLAETHQSLLLNGLRDRVRVEVDGQLRTGRDVAWAAMLGADEFGFATAPLVVEGCIMMRKCHLNTCPVGVATQDPELRKKFSGQPEHVINYFFFVAEELREIMASLGIRRVQDLVGRNDLLEFVPPADHWKAKHLDLSRMLMRVPAKAPGAESTTETRSHFDQQLLKPFGRHRLKIRNTDRSAGTWLAGEFTRRLRTKEKFRGSLDYTLYGSAGQSFGAFLAAGITLRLTGQANDYVGKGLSGGRLILRSEAEFAGEAATSVIAGNTCLYGATSGRAFISGVAGERFAVRNSGATAVVEGVGDHGCEYMTGGCVVVLGAVGKNFAAGMSGGLAFVFDEGDQLKLRCNRGSVELDLLSKADEALVLDLLREHLRETDSVKARAILSTWIESRGYFKKIIPTEYKTVLLRQPVEAQA